MKRVLFALFGLLLSVPAFAAILPAGYTQVEYIESTGTQYIDTGIKPTNNTKIDITYSSNSFNHFLFGSRKNISGDDQQRFIIYLALGSGETKARLNPQYANTNYPNIGNATVGTKYNVVMDSNGVLQDGVSVQSFSSATFTGEYNLVLFGNNTAGTVTGGENTIYAVKLYDNNTLVRNFVPAQTVINGETVNGMYDTVNNRFYKDDAGGNFIAGPEACPNGGVRRDYVSASGTGAQVGTPTPEHPIEPTFYHQGRMILRAVGDYKDSYDASTGKITRRVGVKVLDGTENWEKSASWSTAFTTFGFINSSLNAKSISYDKPAQVISNYFVFAPVSNGTQPPMNDNTVSVGSNAHTPNTMWIRMGKYDNVDAFKTWLKQQYDNGTPVTIYYPLATPTEETWSATSWCDNGIKVATKDYVTGNHGFGPISTTLNTVIATIEGIVSSTVTQATSISTLATQKQTRPDDDYTDDNNAENCPPYRQCLLVEGTDSKPHWYEIMDPFYNLFAAVIPNDINAASTTAQVAVPSMYTQLAYIEGTGTQYIDTGYQFTSNDVEVGYKFYGVPQNSASMFGSQSGSGSFSVIAYGSNGNLYVGTSNTGVTTTFSSTDLNDFVVKAQSDHNATVSLGSNTRNFTYSGSILKTLNMYLFANNFNNSAIYKQRQKAVHFYIKDNGTLVRDLVPAKYGNDVGMYDTVNNQFYQSAENGTNFIAGPVVPNQQSVWTVAFAADATNNILASTVYGAAVCNAVSGVANTAATATQLSNANWGTAGANCWCHIDNVTDSNNNSGAGKDIWVWLEMPSGATCATGCARGCATAVATGTNDDFRSAISGV